MTNLRGATGGRVGDLRSAGLQVANFYARDVAHVASLVTPSLRASDVARGRTRQRIYECIY